MSLPEDEDNLPEEAPGTLPHWTEPPTGEVPAFLSDMDNSPEDELGATTKKMVFHVLGRSQRPWRECRQ